MYITAFQAMLPQVLKTTYKKEIVRMTEAALPADLERFFAGRDVLPYQELQGSGISYYQLQKAIQDGDIIINYLVKSKITKKQITMIKPARAPHLLEEALMDIPKNANRQRQLLAFFMEHPEEIEQGLLINKLHTNRNAIKALIDKSLITSYKTEVYRNPYDDDAFEPTTALKLTEQQETAITPIKEDIASNKHEVFLLHGVTGSGRSEEHTSELQSRGHLVCRLLLENKKKTKTEERNSPHK